MKNKETFRWYFWDLNCYYDVASDVLGKHNQKIFEDTTLITIVGATFNKVECDSKDL